MAGTAGRKRDPARDGVILDAALEVLADQGFDGTTIDMVAAKAGMARATVYRRWPTKVDLVLDAVGRLSGADANADELPDTGTLRGDMLAMIRPFDARQQQVRIQAVAALQAAARTDDKLADAAVAAGPGPWIEVNRTLIERAVARGEFGSTPNVKTLAEVLPMLCLARAAQRLPITRAFCTKVIDDVVIPALRGA